MKTVSRKSKGFTVVELLLALVIISALASVALVSLKRNRADARDAKRMSDLTSLQEAVESFYDDKGYLPYCTGGSASYCQNPPSNLNVPNNLNICVCTNSATITSDFGYLTALQAVTPYIPSIPKDPLDTSTNFYAYMRGYKKNSDTLVTQTGLSSDYILGTNREGMSCASAPCITVTAPGGVIWIFNTVLGN